MGGESQDSSTEELAIDSGLLFETLPSIDVLNEFYRANGWDADYRQITPGPLQLQIAGRLIGDVSLFRECSGQRIAAASQSPEDIVSVLVALSNEEIRISGHVANPDTLVIVPPGTAMNIAAPSGGDGVTIDIPKAMFREFLHAVAGLDSTGTSGQIASFRPGRRRLAPLHQFCKELLSGADYRRPEHGDDARIVTRLCKLLRNPASKPIGGDPYRRISKDRVVRRAKGYIHAHLDDDIRVPDLCRYSAVSLSTLERVFKQEIGVTPNQYLQVARLHEARHEIRNEDALHLGVADIASRCGFTHMGRFSEQYHRQFGVLPSRDRAAARPRI